MPHRLLLSNRHKHPYSLQSWILL